MRNFFKKSFPLFFSLLIHAFAIGTLIYLHLQREEDTRWSGGRGDELGTIYIRVSQDGSPTASSPTPNEATTPAPIPTSEKSQSLKIKSTEKKNSSAKSKTSSQQKFEKLGDSTPKRSQGIGQSDTPAGGIGPGLDPDGVISQEAPHILAAIRKKIVAKQSYPFSAREQGITGVVKLSFQINPDGNLAFVKITESSGSKLLDEAAAQAVKKAAPLPYYPNSITLSLQFLLD